MPDTPIISTINGPQYIADTTVQNVSVQTTADTTSRTAASIGYINQDSKQDTPASVQANAS